MADLRLAVLSGGLSQPSSSRLLADRLGDATAAALRERGHAIEITTIELRDLAREITDNLLTGFPAPALDKAIADVTGADGLIAVTPTFSASFSGLFKSFVDVIEPERFARLPVLMGATGGSARHSLVLEHALRPLFSYLKAETAPTGVYAASEDWAAGGERGLQHRVDRAGEEFATIVERSAGTRPQWDPFALGAGELLGPGGPAGGYSND
jgi:FMN reductase